MDNHGDQTSRCLWTSAATDSPRPVIWRRTVSRPATAAPPGTPAAAVKGTPPLPFSFSSFSLPAPSSSQGRLDTAQCLGLESPGVYRGLALAPTGFAHRKKGYEHVCGFASLSFSPKAVVTGRCQRDWGGWETQLNATHSDALVKFCTVSF